MSTVDRYPDWPPRTPHTDPNARVCRYRYVSNVRAVRLDDGSYRSAPASGIFELYDSDAGDPVFLYKGTHRVKVMCAWLGHKPSQSCARIEVDPRKVTLLEHYTGDVVDNIGHPTDAQPLDTAVLSPASDWEAPLPQRVETTISRIVRDTQLANLVKSLHKNCCQICGETIRLTDGSTYSEGHHLQPLGKPHYGPDVAENILCVCPNHHAACDFGAIQLAISGLRQIAGHNISEKYIAYHNAIIQRGRL
jgi:hypothetical protein